MKPKYLIHTWIITVLYWPMWKDLALHEEIRISWRECWAQVGPYEIRLFCKW